MSRSNLVVTVFPYSIGYRGEGFVANCGHRDSDATIYIAANIKHWRRVGKKHDWADVMTSFLSHETLHLAVTKVTDDKISMLLDNFFGDGEQYRREYHGLCKLAYHFYRHWNRRKK